MQRHILHLRENFTEDYHRGKKQGLISARNGAGKRQNFPNKSKESRAIRMGIEKAKQLRHVQIESLNEGTVQATLLDTIKKRNGLTFLNFPNILSRDIPKGIREDNSLSHERKTKMIKVMSQALKSMRLYTLHSLFKPHATKLLIICATAKDKTSLNFKLNELADDDCYQSYISHAHKRLNT